MGLVWGSFVNVVIYRLPNMMERQWREEARAILELPEQDSQEQTQEKLNLVVPRSACPECGHKITAMENIPVLSYMFLRGKCGSCKAAISLLYPTVELLCATGAMACVHILGAGWQGIMAAVLTWALVALAVIDLRHTILPDCITLPFMWLGIAVNIPGLFVPLQDAVLGAIVGYLVLWLLFHSHRLLSGREGMGYGDFKLTALFGAWMGWQKLPTLLLLAAIAAIIFAVARAIYGSYKKDSDGKGFNDPMPFGPSLVLAGWSVFVFDIDFLAANSLYW